MLCRHKAPATAGLKSSWIPPTLLPDFSSSFHIMHARPSVAASGKVIVNRSAHHLCNTFVEFWSVKGASLKSRTGTASVDEHLYVSMCLCESFCETESVWGHAEWETSILFGHTADFHSPYSQTLTFWKRFARLRLPLLPRRLGPITQSQLLPPSVREHLAPQVHSIFCSKSVIHLLLLFPLVGEHNIINIICTSKTHYKNTFFSGQWNRKTNEEGDEKRQQEHR